MTTRFNDQIDALLTAIADEGSDAVEQALQIYDVNDIMAVVAKRLLDVEASGGGGFVPARNVGQAVYDATGAQLTYTANQLLQFSWEFSQGQSDLLNLTVPDSPAPVAAGVYAVSAVAQFAPNSPPKPFFLILALDNDYYGTPLTQGAGGEGFDTAIAVSQTWYCGAASALSVQFESGGDGVIGSVHLTVQRLT